jgi:hypothetical protein
MSIKEFDKELRNQRRRAADTKAQDRALQLDSRYTTS